MFVARNTCIVALMAASALFAQLGTENGEWRYYGGDTIGGPNFPAELVALSLPQPRPTPAAKPAPQE